MNCICSIDENLVVVQRKLGKILKIPWKLSDKGKIHIIKLRISKSFKILSVLKESSIYLSVLFRMVLWMIIKHKLTPLNTFCEVLI